MKKKPKLWIPLLLLGAMMLSVYVEAQQVLTGTVVSAESSDPLVGVSVTVKGTNQGATTDGQGQFTLQGVAAEAVIVFSAVGYEVQEIPLNGVRSLEVILKSEVSELDEVVVVGYGEMRKKDLTGAVSTVSARDISERQSVQVSQALQGAMAGVTVTRNSGAPGSSSTIRIRGITTIGNNDALIVIDGVPNANIDNVNPNDIENITVLKDAASASIYGSRAAAGVILITTKRAKQGQASLDYNYEFGLESPRAMPEYTDVVRYMELFNERLANDGSAPLYAQDFIADYWRNHSENPDLYPATDWQAAVFKNKAPRHRHDLAFTMGSERVRTKASLSYIKVDGLYENRSYDRYTARVNNDMTINKKLNANFDIFYKRTYSLSPAPNVVAERNPIFLSRVMPGIYDDVYEDGRFAPGKEGLNIVADLKAGGQDENWYNQLGGRFQLDFKPLAGLTFKAVLSPTLDFNKSKTFAKVINFTDLDDPSRVIFTNRPVTTLDEARPEGVSFNGQLLVNYARQFSSRHNIDLVGGYEELYYRNESLSASRQGFALTDFPYLNLGSQALRDNGGSASESALRSFFSRANYNFMNKYYIQLNGRFDGSSRFHPDHRWAFFPSLSAGWTVTEESFMDRLPQISFLKVRGSWGVVGNERIGNYPYQSSISFNDALFYQGGQVVSQTSGAQLTYAVQDITWESTESLNFGLDMGFADNRLNVTADYFTKDTRDILLQLDIPSYLGFQNPNQNAGAVSAKGWELGANWNDRVGNVDYAIAFNISDTKTRIDDLKGTQLRGDKAKLEGGEFDEWFGYLSDGIYQSMEEVENSAVLNNNVRPGDIRYIDTNEDGAITPEDKVLLGGSLPRYTYGGNVRIAYRGVDLSAVFQGVGKTFARLQDVQVQPFLSGGIGNVPSIIEGRFWSPQNTTEQNNQAIYPRLSSVGATNNYQMSDFWLINGAYFRIKNLTLGYHVSENFARKLGLQRLRCYLAVNDLVALHHFPTGWDPESTATSYPIVSTYMAGVNFKF